ncbi:hypothetical protein FHX64_001257 [Microbacter margulisiae]|uniref:Uncharacterized protein n=1 Tax=Microbacter margulisiae TaxID=1350067 RepID=A0A7W5DQB5_9PORP|nr:hypothetical protein [Microbacter margulisiae]
MRTKSDTFLIEQEKEWIKIGEGVRPMSLS